MKALRLAMIGLLAVAAGVAGWYVVRTRSHRSTGPASSHSAAPQPAGPVPQNANPQIPASTPAPTPSPSRLGPFSIAGRNFTVDLENKKLGSGAPGDTVVAMEIKDDDGAVQFRRSFPYAQPQGDEFESWSVNAFLLKGANGSGLLVTYNDYFEPSAPEEEPTGWYQIFGVLDGKLVPFGAPLAVVGGLLTEYTDGHMYKTTQPIGAKEDAVEFKVWTGHCRLIFPVQIDWAQGKLKPAQECASAPGGLSAGCQYKVLPEEQFYRQFEGELTFVRLWPTASETQGKPEKAVVKKDSKVELMAAFVATGWTEGKSGAAAADSKGLQDEAGGFGVASGADLWIKVRIDGKEGWLHSNEDFRALGLPEDE
jgi:hypothetical protein